MLWLVALLIRRQPPFCGLQRPFFALNEMVQWQEHFPYKQSSLECFLSHSFAILTVIQNVVESSSTSPDHSASTSALATLR